MCTICVKKAGVPMPSWDRLDALWANNPDGVGYMFWSPGRNTVTVRKGFMTFSAYAEALEALEFEIDTTQATIVLHTRITTHGGTTPGNCHPFPVSSRLSDLQKLETRTRLAIAHNGIIPIDTPPGISDTMQYIMSQLAPLHAGCPKFYKNKSLLKMVENAICSKMVFLDGSGHVATIGSFIADEDGCLYSNDGYLPRSIDPWDWWDSLGDV